jgi:hypothetical protein
MATQKQIEANRLNAQRSTGPRTPEGRAKSSQNALRYGLTAAQIIVRGESENDFLAYYAKRYAVLDPRDFVEEGLAERIITCEWRLRRAYRAEAGLMASGGGAEDVFHGMAGEMAALSRYETAIDRALQRARHELERRQARRRGEAVAAPIAVTISEAVDVSDEAPQKPPRRADDSSKQISLSLAPPMADVRPEENHSAVDGSYSKLDPEEVDHAFLRNEPDLIGADNETPSVEDALRNLPAGNADGVQQPEITFPRLR